MACGKKQKRKENGMESGYSYFAFISYKHENQKWARWLKRKLQTYRLPTRTLKVHEDLPKRLIPIFYDTNLRPGILDDQIRSEVQASKFLIVICSREANREPKWLNKEIDVFLEGKGDRSRIIPVIIDQTDNPVEETFPSRLAELNAEEDILGVSVPLSGKRNAILKIVSCMQDVRIEELESEDRKRKKRKTAALLACSAIIAAGLTFGLMRFREVNLSQSYEKAGRLLEVGSSALEKGKIPEAVQNAVDAYEIGLDGFLRKRAEYTMEEALYLYGTDPLVPGGQFETNGNIRGICLSEDGKVVLAEGGIIEEENDLPGTSNLAAFSAETGKNLWTWRVDSLAAVGNRLYVHPYKAGYGEIVEVDFLTGEEIRKVTDAAEKKDISFRMHQVSDKASWRFSPDGKWKIGIYQNDDFYTIENENGSNQASLGGAYADAVFLDDHRIMFAMDGEITIYDPDTRERQCVISPDREAFGAPVCILPGEKMILCFLKGHVLCIDPGGDVLSEWAGDDYTISDKWQTYGLENGVVAAGWIDEDKGIAAIVCGDGQISVARGGYSCFVRRTREATGYSPLYACMNSFRADRLVLADDRDPWKGYLYRLHSSEAFRIADSLAGIPYDYVFSQDGRYMVRNFTLETYQTVDGTQIRNESEAAAYKKGPFSAMTIEDVSPDGQTVYFYAGAYDLSQNRNLELESVSGKEKPHSNTVVVLAPSDRHPAIHAGVTQPKNGSIELVVYENLKETWRTELPLAETYDTLPVCTGKNGWYGIWGRDGNGKMILIMADLYQHRWTALADCISPEGWRPEVAFGTNEKDPVCFLTDEKSIRVIRCTDGQEIKTIGNPSGQWATVFSVRDDALLMLFSNPGYSLWVLDTKTGETLFTRDNSFRPAAGRKFEVHYAEDNRYLYYGLAYEFDFLKGNYFLEGYRIDSQNWVVDRRYPGAVKFAAGGEVICADSTETGLYVFPEYSAEDVLKKAREYLDMLK